MPRDLFGAVVRSEVRVGGRSWYSLPVTVAAHATVIAVAVIAPLVATDTLPGLPRGSTGFMAVAPPAPPPVPPPAPRRAVSRLAAVNPDAAPVDVPAGIEPESGIEPVAEPADGVPGSLPGTIDGAGVVALPEPPPPAPAPVAPMRITSDLRPPAKIRDVLPVYPELAMRAHVGGVVILEATIDAHGKVVNVKVLRSVALLDQAAADAVRQWEFTPTRLNGVAVPVVMTVTVNFTLK